MILDSHANETLANKTIRLDDSSFTNCRLIDCKIMYGGGHFQWTNTQAVNCQFQFADEAQRTVALLVSMGLMPPPNVNSVPAASGIKSVN
jgi:hypothetical protein